jgi:hypothetical protein
MHGSSDNSRLWIRVFAAPVPRAATTIIGPLAALLWGSVVQYVARVTVGIAMAVIASVWVRCRTRKPGNFLG